MSHYPSEYNKFVELFGEDSDTEFDATLLSRSSCSVPIIDTTNVFTNIYTNFLEQHGQVTIPIRSKLTVVYIDQLIRCYENWFTDLLSHALGTEGDLYREKQFTERKGVHDREYEWIEGQNVWRNMLSQEHRDEILSQLTLANEEGRQRVMDNTKRKQFLRQITRQHEEWKHLPVYLSTQIQWAVNGGSVFNMGTASVGRSISRNGFCIGVFCYHMPLVQVLLETRQLLYTIFNKTFFIGGRPSILFKVGGGETLKAHTDQRCPYDLLLDCLENVKQSPSRPNITWMVQHGIQTIVHLKGATTRGGNTYTLSNMNPWRMLVCMLLLHPKHPHPEMRFPKNNDPLQWWKSVGVKGPMFFEWDKKIHLVVVNRIVQYMTHLWDKTDLNNVSTPFDFHWLTLVRRHNPGMLTALMNCTSPMNRGRIDKLPIRRLPHDDPSISSYLGVWLVGFIHGSLPTNTDRITILTPLRPDPMTMSEATRITEYQMKATEYVVTTSDEKRKEIEVWWTKNRLTEADGSVHIRVITELELIRDAFKSLAPTMEEAQSFRDVVMSETSTDVSGSVPMYKGDIDMIINTTITTRRIVTMYPATIASPLDLPSPNYTWRLFTMDSPWGQLISDGYKPLENRPMSTVQSSPFVPGSWLAIHVSVTKYEKIDMKTNPHIPPDYQTMTNRGSVVAVARVGYRTTSGDAYNIFPTSVQPWIERNPHGGCIVWDLVLRLNQPFLVTSGQGTPILTNAPIHLLNTKKEPKTDVQVRKATRIAHERRSCSDHIISSLLHKEYSVTRHVIITAQD